MCCDVLCCAMSCSAVLAVDARPQQLVHSKKRPAKKEKKREKAPLRLLYIRNNGGNTKARRQVIAECLVQGGALRGQSRDANGARRARKMKKQMRMSITGEQNSIILQPINFVCNNRRTHVFLVHRGF